MIFWILAYHFKQSTKISSSKLLCHCSRLVAHYMRTKQKLSNGMVSLIAAEPATPHLPRHNDFLLFITLYMALHVGVGCLCSCASDGKRAKDL